MKMCTPCGPMVCYKYEDCGSSKTGKPQPTTSNQEESGQKNPGKGNDVKRIKSRELRGGIMYYSCHCIKRNGLQHDCRRTGCGGDPACLHVPDPLCAPSQLARARGLAPVGSLAGHVELTDPSSTSSHPNETGKRFIVCELKGISPEISKDSSKKCKCGGDKVSKTGGPFKSQGWSGGGKQCPNKQASAKGVFTFDEATLNKIKASFDKRKAESDDLEIGSRKSKKPEEKECRREGCVHWKPPPPCSWDAPCKADCFETPLGVRPGNSMYYRKVPAVV